MPRFNIPERRVGLESGRATAQAFGSGVGQAIAGAGQAVGDVARDLIRKRDEADNTRISMESTDLAHELKSSLEEFKKRYPDGTGLSDAYQEHVDQKINDYVSTVDPKKQSKVRENLAKMRSSLALESIREQTSLFAATQVSKLDNQIDVASANISRGGDYLFEQDLLQDTINTLPPKLRPELSGEVRDRLLEAEFKRSLDQDGYIETKERLDSGEFDDMSRVSIEKWINAAKGKAKADISDSIRSASRAVTSGQVVPNLSNEIKIAKEMGLKDEVEKLTLLENVGNYSYSFARAGFSKQNEMSRYLREKSLNEPLTDEERLKLEVSEDHIRYRDRMLDSGMAYDYYSSLDIIPDVEPLDLLSNDLTSFTESVDTRESVRQSIMLRDGIDPGVMTPQEVTILQSMVTDTTPGDYSDKLRMIVDGFGKERIATVSKEINKKDERLAGDLSIASSDPQLLARVKAGRDLPVEIPKEKDIKSKIAEMGYTTSGLSGTVLNNLYQNASDFMKWRVSQGQSIDNTFIEDSLTQFIPKPGVLNNGTFLVPLKKEDGSQIDSNSMAQAFENLTDKDLEEMGIPQPSFGKTKMSIEDIIPHARIIPSDNEVDFYLVKQNTGEPFRDENGLVVTFNAEKMIQQVAARRTVEKPTRWRARQNRLDAQRELSQ